MTRQRLFYKQLCPASHNLYRQSLLYWKEIEVLLRCAETLPAFKGFLENYRGLSQAHSVQQSETWQAMQTRFLEGWQNFFSNLLSNEGELWKNTEHGNELLIALEGAFNLALYYWFGQNDRNFQFRTLVHFWKLEERNLCLSSASQSQIFLFFNEKGILLKRDLESEENEQPYLFPISWACALHEVSSSHSPSLVRGESKESQEKDGLWEKKVFARLRTVQREIYLMIDEWEHCNALLAVEYGASLQRLETENTPASQRAHELVLLKMSARRNSLAIWCAQSLCDFQNWMVVLSQQSFHLSDILLEIEATESLILASLQKLYLPASVSRHRYDSSFLHLVHKWCELRLQVEPQDFAAALTLQAVTSALGGDFQPQLLGFLSKKSFEWQLSYDPATALKAFCWAYPPCHHSVLCGLLLISYARKLNPQPLESRWLLAVFTTLKMPESFAPLDAHFQEKKLHIENDELFKVYEQVEKEIALAKSTDEEVAQLLLGEFKREKEKL